MWRRMCCMASDGCVKAELLLVRLVVKVEPVCVRAERRSPMAARHVASAAVAAMRGMILPLRAFTIHCRARMPACMSPTLCPVNQLSCSQPACCRSRHWCSVLQFCCSRARSVAVASGGCAVDWQLRLSKPHACAACDLTKLHSAGKPCIPTGLTYMRLSDTYRPQ